MKVGAYTASTDTRPRPDAAPKPAPRANHALNALINDLVRESTTDVSGWGRLMVGVELERDGEIEMVVPYLMSPERQAANNAALEVDQRIGQGWTWIAKAGDAVPRSWLERLVALHHESLDRLHDLDVVRRREDLAAGKEPPSMCALILRRAATAADAYLRDLGTPPAEAAVELERLGLAIDADDEDEALLAAKGYVAAAVWAKHGNKVVDG